MEVKMSRLSLTKTGAGDQRGSGSGCGSKKGSSRGSKRPENVYAEFCLTRPAHREIKEGEESNTSEYVKIRANFAKVQYLGEAMYQYHVDFDPPIDSSRMRLSLLNEHWERIGRLHVFDGKILYLRHRLTEMNYESRHPVTGDTIKMKVRLTGELRPDDMQTITVLNVINRKTFELQKCMPFGRHYYDPEKAQYIAPINMEVWPGLVSSLRPYEGNLLLMMDTSHKMLRKDTPYTILLDNLKDGQEAAESKILGQTVITRYNNKTYRIDSVAWDVTPKSTFKKKDGTEITYKEYYEKSHEQRITDDMQPMLVSRAKRVAVGLKDVEMDTSEMVYLVPELCNMTGLTDEMRADRKVMQEVARYTRVGPARRVQDARERLGRLREEGSASRTLLDGWSIQVAPDIVTIRGRQFHGEQLIGGDNRSFGFDPVKADWSRELKRVKQVDSVALTKWCMVVPESICQSAEGFFRSMQRMCAGLGMGLSEPVVLRTPNYNAKEYINLLRAAIEQANASGQPFQLVMAVLPDDSKARYDAIKKFCCQTAGVPSQMVLRNTLRRENILDSISLKVMVQVNCKLGGAPWRIDSKFKKPVMVVGYDCYLDSSERGKQVTSCVISMNALLTKYKSQFSIGSQPSPEPKQQLISQFMRKGLAKFAELNGCFPSKIFIFRDGVGEGQVPAVFTFELKGVQGILDDMSAEYKTDRPELVFTIVNKKVNHRFFLETGNDNFDNPKPGTVIDSVCTRQERYDFYMVPHAVNQGTVTPVSYNVICDETKLKPHQMQLFAYKLCHLYYNWQGTIRVPAPCMYAYKLAFMISQFIRGEVAENLEDKLFFL